MRIKLLVSNLKNERRPDSKIVEIEKSYCVIGRKMADLVLNDPRCSKQHAVFYQAFDGSLHIRDMGSTNGTFVNGVKVVDRVLTTGNEIRIGRCFLTILEFHSVPKTGARKFKEPIVAMTFQDSTHSQPTAMEPPTVLHKRSYRTSFSPVQQQEKNAFIYFIDEEGTENRMNFKEIIQELEKKSVGSWTHRKRI